MNEFVNWIDKCWEKTHIISKLSVYIYIYHDVHVNTCIYVLSSFFINPIVFIQPPDKSESLSNLRFMIVYIVSANIYCLIWTYRTQKRSFLWEPFNGSRGHIYDANYPYLYSHKSWRMIPYSVFAAGIKCNGEHNDWLKTFRLFLLGTLYNFLTFDIYFWSIWNKKKIFDINGENKFFCNLCRVFSLNWSASVLHV